MKGNGLILIGVLFVAAGITGLVHSQWVGPSSKMAVDVDGKQVEVATARVVDIPRGFCFAVIVAGICVAALGAINRTKAHPHP